MKKKFENQSVYLYNCKVKAYWFVRKKYGYGWTPSTVQGWLVVAMFAFIQIALVVLTQHFLSGINLQATIFSIGTVINVVFLLITTILHAPPARWQWGDSSE